MIFQQKSNASDAAIARAFCDFVPEEIFDIHMHTYHSAHFQKEISFLKVYISWVVKITGVI
ncbi:hypothetical protein [Agriterribacter sp.]|uniref:hypothetical protein n=1 Tax=Agriterribacter sp. TaxID=2821509 RepID=UPI002CE8E2C3|nr:hypothetical protein [Agriterribacter sp.]HRP57605.1 hypothetical protein [Agriterribacter sp.]